MTQIKPGDTVILTRCLLHDLPKTHLLVCDDDCDCVSCCDCVYKGQVVTVKTVDNSTSARKRTWNVLTADCRSFPPRWTGIYNWRQLTLIKRNEQEEI